MGLAVLIKEIGMINSGAKIGYKTIHKWSAHSLLALVFLHIAAALFESYKLSEEFSWLGIQQLLIFPRLLQLSNTLIKLLRELLRVWFFAGEGEVDIAGVVEHAFLNRGIT